MQIIINAGGSGSRLWPLSDALKPKQFVAIIDNEPLLLKTYRRISHAFPAENIWITINVNHLEFVQQLLPDFPHSHILTEPERRDTFAAVAAHAAVVAAYTSENEPIIFINSDHHIAPKSSILKHNQALTIIQNSLLADQFEIIVAGIHPTFPSPQYGYIEVDAGQAVKASEMVIPVSSFKEKPDVATAQTFLDSGNYFWNFGAFAFTFTNLKKILSSVLPQAISPLESIFKAKKIKLEDFRELPKTSFDYAVLEKTNKLGMVGIQLEVWDDIGSFDTVYNYLPELPVLDSAETSSSSHPYVQIAGTGNKVKLKNSNLKVAFVGTSNLLFVQTESGILIVDPKHAKEVKNVSQYFE